MFDARKLLDAFTAGASQGSDPARENAQSLPEMARNIFGQATDGVGQGARDLDAATGASTRIDDTVRNLTGGQSAGDLLNSAKGWVGQNPAAAGAIVGGLGALLLGTKTGRSLSIDAAKVGGLALIGGLAYNAYRKHQAGAAASAGQSQAGAAEPGGAMPGTPDGVVPPAPSGSGFEPSALSDADALLYVRAMAAAATADGIVDRREREQITAGLQNAGVDADAAQFIDDIFANPPTPASLAAEVTGAEQAARVYAAARVAIEPDTHAERAFLKALATELGLSDALIASIDQEASAIHV